MKEIQQKIHKKFFESPRLEVGRILIEELTNWESAKKPSDEEFYRLVDRIVKTLTPNEPR